MSPVRSRLRSPLWLAVVAMLVLLAVAGTLGRIGDSGVRAQAGAPAADRSEDPSALSTGQSQPVAQRAPYVVRPGIAIARKPGLPGGGLRVFGAHRFLVAYYGTAETGALGVLGSTDPDTMQRRLTRAARPFQGPGDRVQPVYELIVTIADRSPGPDGDYSHDIPRALVERYILAAHRHGALLLIDLQTGRSPFFEVAKRWAWALDDPWVGLALDPEWRMGAHQVPASVIGSVRAAEVNRTSLWLSGLVRDRGLPEKLFVLHQFRLSMLPDIQNIVHRPGLAMVQHADGFGTRGQKLATYHAITRPQQFRQGFKLFYDWDVQRFTPQEVRRIKPAVSFVSYQ
jgi:hypothetical protein